MENYITTSEAEKILESLGNVSKHPERDILLTDVLWSTGVRVGEAIVLKLKNINDDSILFRNLKQTDPDATKLVSVPSGICWWIKDFCRRNEITDPESFIFKANQRHKPHVSAWYVWWILDKASSEAGIYRIGKKNPKTGGRLKGIYPHLLRHSFAKRAISETEDIDIVQAQLGIVSSKIMQKYVEPGKTDQLRLENKGKL